MWEGVMWGGSEETERKLVIDTLYICMKLWVSISTEEEPMCKWRHRGMQCGHESELLRSPGARRQNAEILFWGLQWEQHLPISTLSWDCWLTEELENARCCFQSPSLQFPTVTRGNIYGCCHCFHLQMRKVRRLHNQGGKGQGFLLLSTL